MSKVTAPSSSAEILRELQSHANAKNVAGMARFGIVGDKRLGISMPVLRTIAKSAGKNHAVALELWTTGIPEAQIVATLVDDPKQVTSKQLDQWVKQFQAWDVCDQACVNLFWKTPFAWQKIPVWAARDQEFVKRAAFALLAVLAVHDKQAPNEQFIATFPLIQAAATDERNFVRKAVNWALRGIGKRNANLNRAALELAREIQKLDSKAARWNATDAIRELESSAVKTKLSKPVRIQKNT